MKKSSKGILFIAFAGTLIISIFTLVSIKNVLVDEFNRSYNAEINNSVNLKIKSVHVDDNSLIIDSFGNVKSYCVKTTKTVPNYKSLCWKNFETNEAKAPIYFHKRYYVWIIDDEENIFGPISVNANE